MMPFLSSISCLLFLLFPLPSSAYRPISIDGSRNHHLDHNPYKPPTGRCKTIPEPNPRRLTVYHSRGSCSPTGRNLRAMDTVEMTDGSREVVRRGTDLGLGTDNYVVTIGLGTPPRDMTVVMDTGSAITWVQCSPCTTPKCHPQKDDLFNPAMSSTYQTFDCFSSQCNKLPSPSCSAMDDPCSYEATYMDNSKSSGQFVSDRLTLNAGNTIDSFLFGCGHDQSSQLFGQTSGLLGLGPPTASLSLPNQAAGTSVGQNFAYCLPQADSTGYLEFGSGTGSGEGSAFATLTMDEGSYLVELLGVEVDGLVEASIISTKMMVDTGTVLSRLSTELFLVLKTLVEAAAGEALVQEDYSSENCYETLVNRTNDRLPINVALKLGGGAQLVLDYASMFYRKGSLTCLAFVEKDDEDPYPVLGNMLQRTYRWSYDIDNSRIAITPNAC